MDMKDLKPRKGAAYLAGLIAEGEHEMQDFKYAVSDACKIARSISAFANHRGGRLLIGVKDNGVVAGVRNEEDLYVVESAAQLYCRPAQEVTFSAYRSAGGEVVMVAEIAAAGIRPVEARDHDGTWRAYFRVDDENIAASRIMTDAWTRRRSGVGEGISITAGESLLLRRLAETGPMNMRSYMKLSHLSLASAELSATRLYSMGVIRLVHSGGEWLLAAVEN